MCKICQKKVVHCAVSPFVWFHLVHFYIFLSRIFIILCMDMLFQCLKQLLMKCKCLIFLCLFLTESYCLHSNYIVHVCTVTSCILKLNLPFLQIYTYILYHCTGIFLFYKCFFPPYTFHLINVYSSFTKNSFHSIIFKNIYFKLSPFSAITDSRRDISRMPINNRFNPIASF